MAMRAQMVFDFWLARGHVTVQDVIISLQAEEEAGTSVGLDIASGEPTDPTLLGIFDNFLVKQQILQSAPVVASQLLLVDEVMRAGVNTRKGGP